MLLKPIRINDIIKKTNINFIQIFNKINQDDIIKRIVKKIVNYSLNGSQSFITSSLKKKKCIIRQ